MIDIVIRQNVMQIAIGKTSNKGDTRSGGIGKEPKKVRHTRRGR